VARQAGSVVRWNVGEGKRTLEGWTLEGLNVEKGKRREEHSQEWLCHKKRREGAGKSGVEPGDMEERFLTWLGMTK
jgi:hypothetical protein